MHLPNRELRPHEFILLHSIERLESVKRREGAVEGPGITVSELSRFTRNSMPSVSQTLRALDEKGMVHRLAKDSDRRVVFVKITPKGYETMEKMAVPFFSLLDAVAEKLGGEDTETLIRLLGRFGDALAEAGAQAKERGALAGCPQSLCEHGEDAARFPSGKEGSNPYA